MLTGGTRDGLSVVRRLDGCDLPHLSAAGTSRHPWMRALTSCEGFAQRQPVSGFVAVL